MDLDDDHHKNRYNINGKIMVTAIISLSFVVLLVTLLHIYVRCVLRRQVRRRASLRPLGLYATAHDSPMAKTGLDPTVIASLPVFTFKQDVGKARAIECAVCLSMLEDGEAIRILPNCNHNFHTDCIDKWLSTNSTCPICRTEAEPRGVVLEPGEATAVGIQPTAPPIDPEGTSDASAQASAKVIGSSSSPSSASLRLSSFRKMLSRERSSQRIQSRSQEGGLEDLERQ